MKRFFTAIILTMLLSLSLGTVALAAENSSELQTSYRAMVMDEADLLTSAEEKELLEYVEPLLEYGNAVFSTVYLSKGANYERNAEDTYYQYFGNEPGVLFQIDMGNRKLTLSCSTEMENRIGSERTSIVDNIYMKATDGDYLGCAKECFREILAVLNDEKIAHDMKYINNAILAALIAILLNFFFVFSAVRKESPKKALIKGMVIPAASIAATVSLGKLIKEYSPQSSSSGGSGGGSSGGGGGGGGGFSGGSSSHGF